MKNIQALIVLHIKEFYLVFLIKLTNKHTVHIIPTVKIFKRNLLLCFRDIIRKKFFLQ